MYQFQGSLGKGRASDVHRLVTNITASTFSGAMWDELTLLAIPNRPVHRTGTAALHKIDPDRGGCPAGCVESSQTDPTTTCVYALQVTWAFGTRLSDLPPRCCRTAVVPIRCTPSAQRPGTGNQHATRRVTIARNL